MRRDAIRQALPHIHIPPDSALLLNSADRKDTLRQLAEAPTFTDGASPLRRRGPLRQIDLSGSSHVTSPGSRSRHLARGEPALDSSHDDDLEDTNVEEGAAAESFLRRSTSPCGLAPAHPVICIAMPSFQIQHLTRILTHAIQADKQGKGKGKGAQAEETPVAGNTAPGLVLHLSKQINPSGLACRGPEGLSKLVPTAAVVGTVERKWAPAVSAPANGRLQDQASILEKALAGHVEDDDVLIDVGRMDHVERGGARYGSDLDGVSRNSVLFVDGTMSDKLRRTIEIAFDQREEVFKYCSQRG